MMEPRERYLQDTWFNRLVDMHRLYIRHGRFTPSELREAVILAATMEEDRTQRGLMPGIVHGEAGP